MFEDSMKEMDRKTMTEISDCNEKELFQSLISDVFLKSAWGPRKAMGQRYSNDLKSAFKSSMNLQQRAAQFFLR